MSHVRKWLEIIIKIIHWAMHYATLDLFDTKEKQDWIAPRQRISPLIICTRHARLSHTLHWKAGLVWKDDHFRSDVHTTHQPRQCLLLRIWNVAESFEVHWNWENILQNRGSKVVSTASGRLRIKSMNTHHLRWYWWIMRRWGNEWRNEWCFIMV